MNDEEITTPGGQQPPPHDSSETDAMYQVVFPRPHVVCPNGQGPVLIHALQGFSDAGNAVKIAATHLKESTTAELVACFAIDDLFDYRSRRPSMTFHTDHFTHYSDPELKLYALHDANGTPFLLLSGLEPDLHWERFITAVRLLAEQLHVRLTIGLGTIPMAIPHTRPTTVTAHSNNRELIKDFTPWLGEIQVPSSASNLLEYRMAQHGHEVVGFTVHVPHYLAQMNYPEAAQVLLEHTARVASLQFSLDTLGQAAAEIRNKINEQVDSNVEIAHVVKALEQQYDNFISAQENRALLDHDEDLPSADELGEAFEQFLADEEAKKHSNSDHEDT